VAVARALLVLLGAVALGAGIRRIRSLRRRGPWVSPNLIEYRPGPDLLDWAGAVALLVIGVLLGVLAFFP
jgi:hypothetical protein